VPSAPAPRLQRIAAALVVIAFTIGVGTLIGTEFGHRRAANQLKDRAERIRASEAAKARREREETRREHEREAPEKAVDDANDALLRAAKAGRRGAVARQEATLDRLARRQAASKQDDPISKHPYWREVDRFPIKEGPLFAQQIGTYGDGHLLFVSIFRAHFCLKSERERREAVRKTYEPIARRLHRRKIEDFELFVVPLGQTAPRRSAALARATDGTVVLTGRGQSC